MKHAIDFLNKQIKRNAQEIDNRKHSIEDLKQRLEWERNDLNQLEIETADLQQASDVLLKDGE